MPSLPLPLESLFAAVTAYHQALAEGWPAYGGDEYQGGRNALQVAGERLGLRAGKNISTKTRLRIDTAFILGVCVTRWSLNGRWTEDERRNTLLRYKSYLPGFHVAVAAFNAGETPPIIPESRAATPPTAPAGMVIDAPLASIEGQEPLPSPEPRDALEARRDKNLITSLRANLKAMEERAVAAEDKIATMDALHMARVEPAEWLAVPAIKSVLSLTPVLFTSDFQCGEVVRPDEIDGINEYNQDIFCQRYQTMIEKTIMLATENTGATEFPGLIYLRGGDAISGEIHAELAETNDLSAVPAARLVFQQEREGIRRLRDRFGRVRVISLPGNHGRTTFKPHAKGYTERNFELLISWWLAESFQDEPNITFWTPKSADALFDVEGWNGLLSHGDRMGSRGGQGFIGPAATIARGHQKLFQNWTATGSRVDFILTGHLHTSLKLERGYANGSLAGYGEYARDLRALPDAAKQWLFFFHRETMVSHQFELLLSPKPRRFVTDASEFEA